MKKICILLALLTLLLCSCSIGSLYPQEAQTSTTTIEETTPQPIPHKHLFEDEIITREASCTEIGFKKATCSCGLAQEIVIPATGHTFGEAVITKPATCTEAGVKSITCLSCGKVETTAISATGEHTFGEAIVTKDPTCAEDGEATATCSTCDATEKTTIRATGEHTFGEAVVTKKPTCVENGEKTATCSVCGAYQTTVIFATGIHTFGEAVVSKNPTCVQDGETVSVCTVCLFRQKTTIPATGAHTFGEAVVTKQPTCAQEGERTATCSVCGATERTVIPTTGEHTYGDWVILKETTCVETGIISTVCSVCGDEKQIILPPNDIDHVYRNGLCVFCGKSPIPLYPVPSNYDADGDGEKDVYNFSTELLTEYEYGIHLWGAQYDKTLSANPSKSSVNGVLHWYVTEFTTQTLVFKVTVPETGVYEMVINVRLKDDQVRGTKYTVNGGTDNEQVFETSYGYDRMNYTEMRDDTHGAYMYGITVNLIEGENIIKIEHAPDCPKSQHYRHFYFVKVGEYHAHVYENKTVVKPATCATNGEKTSVCACGKIKTTVIPATQNHTFVNDVCTGCGKKYVPAGIVSYDFLYDAPGFAGGTLTFLPETSDVYTFYWADDSGKLKDYTMLYSDEFAAGIEAEVTIQSFTAIPKGATRLIAVSGDNTVVYSYTIPTSRLFTDEELYVFGALSDTHQGTRYGSTDIPYNHFINAAKTLWKKGAITIGICGDFSYANIESEYVLHSKAIQEIYVSAPKMPIFTTTGNHESKTYGFSYDLYMQYARDVVDYDSDLDYIYFDGNELDYVVELPDGSVMIYFHQVYYDYGKSTSRLVTDAQLDWLGARLEQYKDRTVFFFFHTFMDEKVGDATSSSNEYELPLISSTVEYKKFDEYFTKYTNVVYFSGHSHWAFDSQFVDPKPGKTNYDKNIDNRDGTFATMVHIPACSTPRVLTGSGSGRSEGYIIHVYESCIVLEGYEFVKGETFAYATYIIEK